MVKNYKYSNLKRETNTSGEVTLSTIRKSKPGGGINPRTQNPPKWFLQFSNNLDARLDKMENRINGHLNQIDSRLDRVERQIHFVADKTNVDLKQIDQSEPENNNGEMEM